MKLVKKNPQKKEDEQKIAEDRKELKKQRDKYLTELKKSRLFQEFVIRDIIEKNLNELTDIRKIKSETFKDMEEVGKLVMQNRLSRAVLERMLGELIN